jgi:hypothetical protein
MRRNASNLAALLQDLRPDAVPVERWDTTPEAVAAAWINATAARHWAVEIPLADWLRLPMLERAAVLALVHPVVRCKTLLGYAYAGLVVHYDERYRTLELSRAGMLPGVDPLPGRCHRCGRELLAFHVSGRKRRADAQWCDSCRRDLNTEAQGRRRAGSAHPQPG